VQQYDRLKTNILWVTVNANIIFIIIIIIIAGEPLTVTVK